jgi:hypothetical protein
MSARVGDDIESICSKCGDVWHVVVAKVGEKIAKVLCKQCGATHRYKPPDGVKPVGGAAGSGGVPRKRAATEPRSAPVPEARVPPDLTKPVRRYAASEMYTTGERLTHPTFGEGIVESSPGPGKIEVFFTGGRRVLAQAKTVSTLERPKGGTGGPGVG